MLQSDFVNQHAGHMCSVGDIAWVFFCLAKSTGQHASDSAQAADLHTDVQHIDFAEHLGRELPSIV